MGLQIGLWILALVVSVTAFAVVYRADVRRAVPRPWLTAGLRALSVLLVFLLLLSPAFTLNRTDTEKPVVVLLQDDSRSAGEALQRDTAAFRQAFLTLQQQLGERARVVPLHFGTGLRSDSGFRYNAPATDIAGALRGALERTGSTAPAAIILATDGRYNTGLNPVYQALPVQAPIHVLAIGDSTPPKDLRFARVYAPRIVSKGTQFEIRADVLADGCAGYEGRATLAENGNDAGNVPLSIGEDRYDRAVSFSVLAEKPGLHAYTLTLPVAPGESNTANNLRRVFVEVVEQKKKLLLAAAAPHPDVAALREALTGLEGYDLTVRTGPDAASGGPFDGAILHGFPAVGAVSSLAPRTPVWYILTSGTDATAFNAAQKAVTLDGSAVQQRDAYAVPAKSFALFTLPAGLGPVADRLPPLAAPAAPLQAAPDAVPLFLQRDGSSPLWAFQSGTPAVAVTAGEGLWRWRLAEYRTTKAHRVVDECIRQTVAFLTAAAAERSFRVEQPKAEWSEGEAVSFNAYLLNATGAPINGPDVSLLLTDSAGRTQRFSMERIGQAYQLSAGTLASGTYRYRAGGSLDGKAFGDGGSFVVQSTPLELLQGGADYPLLHALAARYSGTVRPWQQSGTLSVELLRSDALKPRLVSRTERLPLIDWKPFFFLLLVVAATEWLLRRWWSA